MARHVSPAGSAGGRLWWGVQQATVETVLQRCSRAPRSADCTQSKQAGYETAVGSFPLLTGRQLRERRPPGGVAARVAVCPAGSPCLCTASMYGKVSHTSR